MIVQTKLECICDDEWAAQRFEHKRDCPIAIALDAAYCKGWHDREATKVAFPVGVRVPEDLPRAWPARQVSDWGFMGS